MAKRPYISIVMPAYNEEENIETTLIKCFQVISNFDGEVVVVNDGSKDNTLSILERLNKEFPCLVVVNHVYNMGYGAALKDAILAARGEIVVSIDSDGQFDISELPQFLKLFNQDCDIISGFRMKKQDNFLKVISDRGLNLLVRLLFGLNLKDSNCAFKLFKSEVLKKIQIESKGFSAPTEIVVKLSALGYTIRETAISHSLRKMGKSSLRPMSTICKMLLFLIYLKFKIKLFKKLIISTL